MVVAKLLGVLALVSICCSCSKSASFQGPKDENKKGDENLSAVPDPDQTVTPGSPAGTPTPASRDAQKDDKTFLALTDEKPVHELKEGDEQIQIVCARNAAKTNKVVKAFCIDKIKPKSLIELQQALGIAVTDPTQVARNQNGAGANPAFVFTGHSSSLVARFTSAINPRAIIFSDEVLSNNAANPNYVVMGFVRGEQFAEIIVNNPSTSKPDFFLVAFKQACNDAPGGCSVGELLTPAIESNWTSFTLFEDEDLKNTIVDCRHCHQPEGPNGPKILRMAELKNPWTHFFRDNTAGVNLINDYYAAHGKDETYAGIPGPMINGSDPQKLENLVIGNGFMQLQAVGQFLTNTIQNEVAASSPKQPVDNTIPGTSATWDAFFKKVVDGLTIPVPYHDVKVTEPSLLATFTKQYQDFKAGTLPVKDMQDHREVLRPDPKQRADMGFAIAPGTSPQDTLALACRQCHNSKLDATITRSRFNVDFAAMTKGAAELDIAIARVRLGYSEQRLKAEGIRIITEQGEEVQMHRGEHLLTMPPRRFKQLTDEQIDGLVKYFQEEKLKLTK